MQYRVVIPTKTVGNIVPCLAAIREHEPDLPMDRVIVVDDGLDLSEMQRQTGATGIAVDFQIIKGRRPFVFARNCNIGMRHAFDQGADVVVLLNDDALLQSPNGLSILAESAMQHTDYGVIAAACNSVGNPNQFPRNWGLRGDPRMVCFVCVAITKETIQKVGYMDERYVFYGLDDDDFSFECRKHGLKIGIHDGCVVDHLSLKSSFRGDPKTPADFRPNMQIFINKWGHDNWGLPAEQARRKWSTT